LSEDALQKVRDWIKKKIYETPLGQIAS
jgi:hypothetical protein